MEKMEYRLHGDIFAKITFSEEQWKCLEKMFTTHYDPSIRAAIDINGWFSEANKTRSFYISNRKSTPVELTQSQINIIIKGFEYYWQSNHIARHIKRGLQKLLKDADKNQTSINEILNRDISASKLIADNFSDIVNKKVGNRNLINTPTYHYKTGDFIRKANFELFKNPAGSRDPYSISDFLSHFERSFYWCLEREGTYLTPFQEVKRIKYIKFSNQLMINEKYYPLNSLPIIITKEEAKRLLQMWENIQQESIGECKNKKHEHIREDNGEEKIGHTDTLRIRRILFKYRNLHPDGNFELYNCSICGKIHLGKRNIVPTVGI